MALTSPTSVAQSFSSRETGARAPELVLGSPPPPDTTAPSAPLGLTAAAIAHNRVDLTWLPSADDTAVAGYTVYRDGAPLATVDDTQTSYWDATVAPETTYTYTVDAFDAASNRSPQSVPAGVTTPPAPPVSPDPVIAAAGDIACNPASGSFNGGAGTATNCRQRYTSDLLTGGDLAAVLTLGDNQYDNATLSEFLASYDPSWGRAKPITHPAIGNHEYLTAGAAGYFDYFGTEAGERGSGYYSFDVGTWHLVALNSNCSKLPAGSGAHGCDEGSPQNDWLEADLAAHPSECTLAYWHHPRYSSGGHGNHVTMTPSWRDLYAAGAEVVLNGHSHDYERFAPQDPVAGADPQGIREFVVGTGGVGTTAFGTTKPNSEVRATGNFGVLRLTLHPNAYDWSFAAAAGSTLTDAGSAPCH